jgi:hypothetical protein
MSGESIQKMFEEERDEEDEGWIDQYDNSKIHDEGREECNHDEPKSSLLTKPCTPIKEDFEIDWSWLFNHAREFIAKEMIKMKIRASDSKDKWEKI